MNPKVDVVVLTRHAGPLHPEVERGLLAQVGVQVILHRVVGSAESEDRCRWDAIARGRNEGKLRGNARWLMFLDDDVVLEPRCVAALVSELIRRPLYGALAADYLGERREGQIAPHVAMGATLFRREALEQIRFTWRPRRCECQCCCDNLRQLHWGIDYCRSARARHIPNDGIRGNRIAGDAECSPLAANVPGRVLAAFDRRHLGQFCRLFLASLRAAGNRELVIPLAIGLYASERRRLANETGVEPVFRNENGQTVARRRLRDFSEITSSMPAATPVAYWDAGDIVFQARLQPLWDLVRKHPDKLLAAREPCGYPDNPAVAKWTQSISDPSARCAAQEVVYRNAFLNSGFAAGTAGVLSKYFRTVANWYDSPKLGGSKCWGDQLALNVYCHSHPDAWQEIPESWNYCLCLRDRKTMYRREDGRYIDVRGAAVNVVHGNANTLGAAAVRRKTF